MQKVIIEGQREFSSIDAADRFCDELETAGQDWYSCAANEPSPGKAVVSWGRSVELAMEEDRADGYTQLARAAEKDEKIDADAFNARCESMGREAAGQALAEVAGHVGIAAHYFVLGFCGASAKACNPRAEGMEQAFRDGRLARNTPDGQRAARAAAVAARREA